jgi:hypothetical protein
MAPLRPQQRLLHDGNGVKVPKNGTTIELPVQAPGPCLWRAAASCLLGALAACAPAPTQQVAKLEPPAPTAAPAPEMCAPTPASVPARFTHFSQLGPIHLGGVVLRLHGTASEIDPILRDLEIRNVVTHPCPGGVSLVWIPGGTPRLAALLTEKGLKVAETVEFPPQTERSRTK